MTLVSVSVDQQLKKLDMVARCGPYMFKEPMDAGGTGNVP